MVSRSSSDSGEVLQTKGLITKVPKYTFKDGILSALRGRRAVKMSCGKEKVRKREE
jgi:hypothetical protein